ncbi:MAG TPA: glycoside hydrolase family 3 N-terminal domain-containing protein [Gemmatimonadaceae bacterium]|nr:glycoside hydrolase family 3 N-terminal domain-containing protein [Gemmatimonadaceae bacterium]
MTDLAALLAPAVQADSSGTFSGERARIEKLLSSGVGGVVLRGGTQEAVRALTKELRQRSRVPLLIGADMERGAGQQFSGATGMPPLRAIASLNDREALRRAAKLTAREARTMGVNWALAPVCDLDVVLANPIVGTRAFGSNAQEVAALASDWIDACQSEGVLACAKHFPGHGRTTVDSHSELPVVSATRSELFEHDIVPFRAAIESGVASIMTAHVSYTALDPGGNPATRSREILQWMLRQQLKFEGLLVSDSLEMAGFAAGGDEGDAAVQAVAAGVDVLLAPSDFEATIRALDRGVRTGALESERVHQALRRRLKWAQWASPPNEYRKPALADIAWAAQLADRVVHVVRGRVPRLTSGVDVLVVDDDRGIPGWQPRAGFCEALRSAGIDARGVDTFDPSAGRAMLLALYGDIRPRKGRPGYSAETCDAVTRILNEAYQAFVVQFSHPRLVPEIPAARNVVSAWAGDRAMQEAAARWVGREGRG